jgi:deazaflavin-dependent oxidoreductase (nitroreductase family)
MSTAHRHTGRPGGRRAGADGPETPRTPNPIDRAAPRFIAVGSRVLNPLMMQLASRRALPMFSLVHHRGRRAGRTYTTSVVARRTADGFIIPLTFGTQSDWFRNARAAGGCTVRWQGTEYRVVEPEVIGGESSRSVFYPLERVLVPRLGIEQFARLRLATK